MMLISSSKKSLNIEETRLHEGHSCSCLPQWGSSLGAPCRHCFWSQGLCAAGGRAQALGPLPAPSLVQGTRFLKLERSPTLSFAVSVLGNLSPLWALMFSKQSPERLALCPSLGITSTSPPCVLLMRWELPYLPEGGMGRQRDWNPECQGRGQKQFILGNKTFQWIVPVLQKLTI